MDNVDGSLKECLEGLEESECAEGCCWCNLCCAKGLVLLL